MLVDLPDEMIDELAKTIIKEDYKTVKMSYNYFKNKEKHGNLPDFYKEDMEADERWLKAFEALASYYGIDLEEE